MSEETKTQTKIQAVPVAAQAEGAAVAEQQDKVPSFFTEEGERFRAELTILYNPATGKVEQVLRQAVGKDLKLKVLRRTTEWFEFTVPDYDQITRYRQGASRYSVEAGQTLVDPSQFRHYLVLHHLKDWSLRDKQGNKVPLVFAANGSLEENCMLKTVYKAAPALLDAALAMLEEEKLATA